jgi:hypothetical protein
MTPLLAAVDGIDSAYMMGVGSAFLALFPAHQVPRPDHILLRVAAECDPKPSLHGCAIRSRIEIPASVVYGHL